MYFKQILSQRSILRVDAASVCMVLQALYDTSWILQNATKLEVNPFVIVMKPLFRNPKPAIVIIKEIGPFKKHKRMDFL